MPGPLRAMAYRMAAATGFRVGRVAGAHAGIVPAGRTRAERLPSRQRDEEPPPGRATHPAVPRPRLSAWLSDKPAGESVLPLHHDTAKAIRRDLEAAGIPYATDEGVADFHSPPRLLHLGLGPVRRDDQGGPDPGPPRQAPDDLEPLRQGQRPRPPRRGGVATSLPELDPTPEALAATGPIPRPTATHPATREEDDGPKSSTGQSLESNRRMIAKPLYGETRIGGSNPPLSASPRSGRRNPPAALNLRSVHRTRLLQCAGFVLKPIPVLDRDALPRRPPPSPRPRPRTASSPPARPPRRCACTAS